ncbi:MAG: RING finger protein [Candidatus Ornithomonoglobus sp.]
MAKTTKAKVCPACGKEIKENAATTTCPQCGVVHHMRCWEENNGCYTKGCIAGGKHFKDIKEIANMQHSAYRNGMAKRSNPPQGSYAQVRKPYVNAESSKQKYQNQKTESRSKQELRKEVLPRRVKTPETSVSPAEPQMQGGSMQTGYLTNGRMDEFMQALIQNNIYYYDQKFSMMNMSGKHISWNWASFFLGAYWMMYRKMYLNTLFLVLISWAITFICFIPIVGWFIGGILAIALWVCMGMFGNAIYKRHIEKKYDECSGLSYDHRKQECVGKGGTSAGAVVVYIIISILLNIILMSLLTVFGLLSAIGTLGLML